MSRKHLLILLVLVLVIGGIGVAMFKRDTDAWQRQDARLGQKVLPELQVSDVTHIHIKHKNEELNLVYDGTLWGIKERGGYPADPSLVSELTFKARDWKVVQSQPISEEQRPRVDVAAPDAKEGASTLLEFRGKDSTPLATLYLGKKHLGKPPLQVKGFDKGQPDGRYLLVGSDLKTVLVVADPMNNIEPKPEKWISKQFIRIDSVKRIELDSGVPEASYALTRESEMGDFVLEGARPGQKTDISAALSTTNALYQLAFVDVAPMKPEELGRATRINIDTFDGWNYAIKIAPKPNDDSHMYFTVAVTGEFKKTERVPRKDETPEDKAKRDQEHEERMKRLEAQLAREKTMNQWVYIVETKTLGGLLRVRERFIEQPEKPEPKR
jgi:hypothetical protein